MEHVHLKEPCSVSGCRLYCLPEKAYCSNHQRQYERNVLLGLQDPTPRLMDSYRPWCQARRCRRHAMANSDYCREHTHALHKDEPAHVRIGQVVRALRARVRANPPEGSQAIIDELEMVCEVRKLLVMQAEVCTRTGWKALSTPAFVRAWLATAKVMNLLLKTRLLMEDAGKGGVERLLSNVYARMEREGPPLQRTLFELPPAGAMSAEGGEHGQP